MRDVKDLDWTATLCLQIRTLNSEHSVVPKLIYRFQSKSYQTIFKKLLINMVGITGYQFRRKQISTLFSHLHKIVNTK